MNHKYCIEYDGINGAEFANTDRLIINGVPYTEKEKGMWVEHKNKNGTVLALSCPFCLKSPKGAVRSDFCPNCGADMRGE